MAGFSVMDFFGEDAQAAGQNGGSASTIQLISARKLVASEDNFYSTEDVPPRSHAN